MYEIFELLCMQAGITPYRFCKDKDVRTSTISTWKKKKSLAGPELAKKVCDYFGVSMDYLMTGKESGENVNTIMDLNAERDIAKKFDEIIGDINDPNDSPLYFDGVQLDDKTKEIMASFVTNVRRQFEIMCELTKKK